MFSVEDLSLGASGNAEYVQLCSGMADKVKNCLPRKDVLLALESPEESKTVLFSMFAKTTEQLEEWNPSIGKLPFDAHWTLAKAAQVAGSMGHLSWLVEKHRPVHWGPVEEAISKVIGTSQWWGRINKMLQSDSPHLITSERNANMLKDSLESARMVCENKQREAYDQGRMDREEEIRENVVKMTVGATCIVIALVLIVLRKYMWGAFYRLGVVGKIVDYFENKKHIV
mmetsp:Transcript_11696/g.22414  ORF Transcript_11696/g.22414 Transcript_11696/m.22414 type:complete len:228 (-) Transcript_11696:81-764(-)|eukprot:CAMPEP_0167797110 /NCGR_PEP_ID=MMETSP0111_2-20121227/15450_1 /TAXON_ID=91324 /ORGANISM="Lotharella globosa, Strain CCCM811" /LENGTH=227 /DNA_ID=CAMNT_0007691135 /DNA_START=26 /DNA_END=709 /DNA_ORIENTATION=-